MEAVLPEGEHAVGAPAVVVLEIEIDAAGRVADAKVNESAGEAFDAAALEAVRQFEFSPAEIDGKPSAIRILYEYTFSPPEEPVTTAEFSGVVRRRETKQPLADVTVTLETPEQSLTAVTDANGTFVFADVLAGVVTVRLSGEGLAPVSVEEQLEAGKSLQVAYDVSIPEEEEEEEEDADDLELVVVAPPLRREIVSTTVKAEEGRRVPGTSGDVLRVVESLPGVARSTAGTAQIVVWGASPQDTRIYMDGVPLPRLYHEGGMRSVVHPLFVESIELIPGGYGASWGRALGGLVRFSTRTPERERTGGQIRADILDASAVLTGPIGKRKRVHYAVGARASYFRLWANRFLDAEQREFVPIPTYGDGQIRFAFTPNERDRIEVVGMASSDRLTRGVPNADPALATRETRAMDIQRVYARWTRDVGDGREFAVTPFVGYARTDDAQQFGAVRTSVSSSTFLAGARSNYGIRFAPWVRMDVGLDTQVEVVGMRRVGSLGLPAREGDLRVFGQPPPEQIAADDWSVTDVSLAPYVEAEFSPLNGRLRIIPGLRLDPYMRSVSRRTPPEAAVPAVGAYRHDFAAEPRLSILGRPLQRWELRASVGLYHQRPAPEDLSAAFGTPNLPTSRAVHVVAGTMVSITDTLSVDVTGFYTHSDRLAVRSASESPLRAQALEATGSGRAYGMQALVRQDLWKGLFGWVAYTFMRAERTRAEGEPWRLFDYDQTHILTAVLAYRLPLAFEASARFRYATGFPRTSVQGVYHDVTRNRDQPIFGRHNDIRIPQFIQLDLRVAKTFTIRRSSLEIFLEVLNLWNRSNAEEIVYSPDFSRRGTIRGFPILPVLGLQWDF